MKAWMFLAAIAAGVAGCTTPSQSQQEFAREQHACAELGLIPGTANFQNCVTGLGSALFAQQTRDNDHGG